MKSITLTDNTTYESRVIHVLNELYLDTIRLIDTNKYIVS